MARSGQLSERLAAEPLVRTVREALGEDAADELWIVGGAVRDALLGRPVRDLDLVVSGEPERVAHKLSRAVGGPVFPLSEAFGAWRGSPRSLTCTRHPTPNISPARPRRSSRTPRPSACSPSCAGSWRASG